MKKIMFLLLILVLLSGCTARTPDVSPTAASDEKSISLKTVPPKPRKLVVAYDTISRDYGKEEIIREFEVYNPDVNIQAIKYSAAQYSNVLEQIKVAFMSGNAFSIVGDVFCLYNYNLNHADNGYLADIYELMNNDPDFKKEEYYIGLFEALEYKNKLYFFPTSFEYEFIVFNKTLSEQALESFTALDRIGYPEMLDFYNSYGSNQDLYIDTSYEPSVQMVQNEIAKFVNYEDKTCNFKSEEFINILKLYKTIDSLKSSPEIAKRSNNNYFNPDLGLSKEYVFKRISYFGGQYLLPYKSNNFTHPIPLTNSDGEVMVTAENYSIYAGSKNKDLAWRFLKFATAKERSHFGYYVSPNKVLDRSHAYRMMQSYELYASKETTERIGDIKGGATAKSDYQDKIFENMPIAKLAVTYDQPLLTIVQNEVDLFFLGAQTAEQTAAKIQNKVSLYLIE